MKAPLPVVRESADVVRIFHPDTGEELDLAKAPLADLAKWRSAVLDFEENAKIAKRAVDVAVIARMDRQAKWTLRDGGYSLSAPSPSPGTEYDGEALHEALCGLVEQDLLSVEAVTEAVEIEQTYKVKQAGVKRLLKLGGPVAAAVAACGREVERQRRVSVKHA